MKKGNIIKVLIIIALIIILGIIIKMYIDSSTETVTNNSVKERPSMSENKEKETSAEDVDKGETVNSKEINLSEYSTNLTITEEGTYTLTGSLECSR